MSRVHALPVALLALATLPGFAQEATTAPSPKSTFTTQAKLVVVDVTVRDKDKRPIHGLKASDFALTESGKPQQIKLFEESRAAAISATPAALPKLPPGTFTNLVPSQPNSASVVLLLDGLNTAANDQTRVRHQLIEYLKSSDPHSRIAIFSLTTKLTMLQGFTSDPVVLKQVATMKLDSKVSPLLDDPIGGGTGMASNADTLQNTVGSDPAFASAIAAMRTFEANYTAAQSQHRIELTIAAFNALGRYLSAIPGRKNLLWFAGSIPLTINPTAGIDDPMLAVAGFDQDFREASILMANARVSVYPIDSRGLVSTSAQASQSINSTVKSLNADRFGGVGKEQRDADSSLANDHLVMEGLAHDTGGQAFYNSNGIAGAIAKVVESGSDYYTISYTPSNREKNPDFRKIEVKLAGPASSQRASLSYRRGYYTEQSSEARAAGVAPPPTGQSLARSAALSPGAPPPTEILLKVRVLPAIANTEETIAPGNTTDPKAPLQGPFRRYRVSFSASPREVKFTPTPKGDVKSSVEFITECFGPDGQLVNAADNTMNETMGYQAFKRVIDNGLGFEQDISVPVKGTHFLRLTVHDLTSNRYGSVEIPVSALRDLQPVPPSSAQAVPPTVGQPSH